MKRKSEKNTMTKKDLLFSITAGLITGFLAWRVFDFIPIARYHGVSYFFLVLAVPLLWILGVWLGYFLGKWFSFFNQFGKYATIGFTNAAIDFGVFYFLVFLSGQALGIRFTVFKAISFLVAMANSFVWNKYWAFGAGKSGRGKQEAVRFVTVNVIAWVVNIGVSSFVANAVGPQFGFSDKAWAGLAIIAGSAVSLIFTFIGLRLVVFKR